MPTFAANTSTPVENTRRDIEATLERYGATAFGYEYDKVARRRRRYVPKSRRSDQW